MVDFMVLSAYICNGAVESKSIPDDVELLVGDLLYESSYGDKSISVLDLTSKQNCHWRQKIYS